MAHKVDVCQWCLRKVRVPLENKRDFYVCSRRCFSAEFVFQKWQGDEEIYRRMNIKKRPPKGVT